jgi:nucleotide-binding universal stress UspA family protein
MPFFPTNVIVGTDGTPDSSHALEAGAELALATGSPLHLLHVKLTSGTLHGRPMTPGQRERSEAEGHALLEREVARAQELGVEVEGTHLRFGEHLARVMTDTAAELEAGLLVIGEGRSGALAQALTSGYSTAAVRRSKGSVLVVR